MLFQFAIAALASLSPIPNAASGQAPSSAPAATEDVLRLIELARAGHRGDGAEQDAAYPIGTRAIAAARRLDPAGKRRVSEPLSELLLLTARQHELERFLLLMLDEAISTHGPAGAETLDRLSLLGAFQQRVANYGEAERYRLLAVGIAEALHSPGHAETVSAVGDLARTLIEGGRPIDADGIVARHIEASRTLGEAHVEHRRALLHLAMLRDQQEQFVEADALYMRLTFLSPGASPTDREQWLDAAARLMVRRLATGDAASARALFARSIPIRDTMPSGHPSRLMLATIDAILRSLEGDVAAAAAMLYRAEQEDPRGFSHPDIIVATAMIARLQLLDPALREEAVENARRLVSAFLDRDGTAIERARRGTSSFADAQAAREAHSRREAYAVLVDAAWAGYSSPPAAPGPLYPAAGTLIGDAIDAVQMMNASPASRAMTEMALRGAAEQRSTGLGALVRERQELERAFERLGVDQLLDVTLAGGAAPTASEAAEQRGRIEARIAVIDEQIRTAFPEFAYLSRPGPLGAPEASGILAPDELILMMSPGPSGTDVMTITSEGIGWHRSDWDETRVGNAVRRLLWNAGASVEAMPEELTAWQSDTNSGTSFDRTTAHDLYAALLAPIEPVLANRRHVFIHASGSLSSLPFGMLVTARPEGRDGDPAALRATRWLADRFAISHLPSLQAFYLMRSQPRGAELSARPRTAFLGFGDPALSGASVARGRRRGAPLVPLDLLSPRRSALGLPLADVSALKGLSRLPGTAVELEQMRVAFGAPADAVRLRDRATEHAIRTADLSGARVITFATHGLMAGEIDGAFEPGLVLTPPAEASDEDDGLLTASEIAGLTLNAEWVILSACNSAAGDGAGGGGLSGLARAFFYAGAEALLASHWPVRDDVAAQLTARTIELERSRPALSRAEAFQLAMREIRNDPSGDAAGESWAHPNAWAPFSLFGDGAR